MVERQICIVYNLGQVLYSVSHGAHPNGNLVGNNTEQYKHIGM